MATLILSTIRLAVFDQGQKEPDMHDEIATKFGDHLAPKVGGPFFGPRPLRFGKNVTV
jgi:hypothetical protein